MTTVQEFRPVLNLENSPVLAAFTQAKTRTRIVRGPVGSGKSVTCCHTLMTMAQEQERSPFDGIRYTKAAVIRNTYQQLLSTTLETWTDLFPETIFSPVRRSIPITHHITIPGELDFQVLFLSCDSVKDIRKLLSLELTFVYFNEGREIEQSIYTAAGDRIGRYPSIKNHGVWATHPSIIMDTNSPDEDSFLYEMEMDPPENCKFFIQTAAIWQVDEIPPNVEYNHDDLIPNAGTQYLLNENAENIENLIPGYYKDNLLGKSRDWSRCYYGNKHGYVADGKPVIPAYDDAVMTRSDLEEMLDRELWAGIDVGGGTLSPACILGQRSVRGVWLILAEVVCNDMGLEQFSREINFVLAEVFNNRKIDRAFADPAGKNRDPIYEQTIISHLCRKGIPTIAAPTNQIKSRIESINAPMNRFIDSQPGFLIHPRCKTLRAALAGKWMYKKIHVVGPERFAQIPDKNGWDHAPDALGYLLAGGGEHRVLKGRSAERSKGKTRMAYKPRPIFS